MEQCQLTCEHHEGCKAWNYRLSDGHTVGHCEMLSSVLGAFQCFTGKCISSLRTQRSTVKKFTTEKTKQKSKKSCGKRYRFFCWKHPNWNSSRKFNFLTKDAKLFLWISIENHFNKKMFKVWRNLKKTLSFFDFFKLWLFLNSLIYRIHRNGSNNGSKNFIPDLKFRLTVSHYWVTLNLFETFVIKNLIIIYLLSFPIRSDSNPAQIG